MANNFSAAQQALGYTHQLFRYSLYITLQNFNSLHKSITIEKFDDIEIVDGDSTSESLQIKRVTANLTNRSSDLWKTIRLWCEGYNQGHLKLPDTMLSLITTASASNGSIASFLRARGRNCECALKILRQEAQRSSKTLEKAFCVFNKLTSMEQEMLVKSIYVIDHAPDITDIPDLIKAQFIGVHPNKWDQVFDLLEKWWFDSVINHLVNKSSTPIPIASVAAKIADINRVVDPPQLEDHFFDSQVPKGHDWDERTFVRQLRVIDLPEPLVMMAIRDFYRASKMRNWLIEELHLLELNTYDQKLKEEWEVHFYGSLSDNGNLNNDDKILCELGRKIYNAIQKNVDISIHGDLTGRYITRGSYQVLANNVNQLDIGWHPEYKMKLVTKGN